VIPDRLAIEDAHGLPVGRTEGPTTDCKARRGGRGHGLLTGAH
jgi:hypothetical protein